MLTSPVSAWSKSVGGCICRFGCFGGLGSSACLEVPGIRLDMLSVCFCLRNSFESRLSFMQGSHTFIIYNIPTHMHHEWVQVHTRNNNNNKIKIVL